MKDKIINTEYKVMASERYPLPMLTDWDDGRSHGEHWEVFEMRIANNGKHKRVHIKTFDEKEWKRANEWRSSMVSACEAFLSGGGNIKDFRLPSRFIRDYNASSYYKPFAPPSKGFYVSKSKPVAAPMTVGDHKVRLLRIFVKHLVRTYDVYKRNAGRKNDTKKL